MFEIDEEIRYPKRGDTLIDQGGGKRAKVLFADWMAGKWDHYADGYKLAADRLVDQIEGEPWDDTLIFPVIFLYRHFVELKLKEIVMDLAALSGAPLPDNLFKHEFSRLWSFIKDHLNCLRNACWDNDILPSLERLINELSALDPDSMHSRYPHDRKFKQMAFPRAISLSHFKTMMEAIGNGLAHIEAGIQIEIDGRALDAEFQAEVGGYA